MSWRTPSFLTRSSSFYLFSAHFDPREEFLSWLLFHRINYTHFMTLAPTLDTERLILRQPCLEDAPAHYKHFNDFDVARYLGSSLPWPYPADGSKKFMTIINEKDNPSYYWAITLKENLNEMIGIIELRPHKEIAQRGFWIGKAFQKQGLMTEACFATNDFWFDVLDKDVLMMENAKANPASRKIKEKTGATLVGTISNPGNYVDPDLNETEIWLLTRTMWRRFKNGL